MESCSPCKNLWLIKRCPTTPGPPCTLPLPTRKWQTQNEIPQDDSFTGYLIPQSQSTLQTFKAVQPKPGMVNPVVSLELEPPINPAPMIPAEAQNVASTSAEQEENAYVELDEPNSKQVDVSMQNVLAELQESFSVKESASVQTEVLELYSVQNPNYIP